MNFVKEFLDISLSTIGFWTVLDRVYYISEAQKHKRQQKRTQRFYAGI